jgi:hypothetical protein
MKTITLLVFSFFISIAGLSQNFSVALLKSNGTPLDSLGGKVPIGWVKIVITPKVTGENFRYKSGEIVLARKSRRVATINLTARSFDLSVWASQALPEDYIAFDFLINEMKNGAVFATHSYKMKYPIRN